MYHLRDNSAEALKIIEIHILNKTFEPIAMYHDAEILKVNGNTKTVVDMKAELLESSFEVGPILTQKIHRL